MVPRKANLVFRRPPDRGGILKSSKKQTKNIAFFHWYVPVISYVRTCRNPAPPVKFVVHYDVGRSVVSLSRVAEYLCLVFPWPTQNKLRNAQSLERLSGNTGPNVAPKRYWRAERAWVSGRTREPVTIFSRLGVLACVRLLLERLDFLCVYCVASSGSTLVSSNMTLVLLCTMV